MEDDEGDESGEEEEEDEDVGEGAFDFVEELAGVVEEDALDAEGVGVEPEHAEEDDCQDEAEDGCYDLPGVVVVEETE